MTNVLNPTTDPSQPKVYQIRIEGHLDREWAAWFEGLVVDQAALHGLLKKVRDVGMPLLSVNRVTHGQVDASDVKP